MSEKTISPRAIQIGDWTLVTELNLLRRAGKEVRLEPRHADLLLFMSARCGDVISTEEIIQRVWKGQVVTDHSVYQAVAKVRKAVGDNAAQPRYIETVPKRGYRLIAEVSEIPDTDDRDASSGSAPASGPSQKEVKASPGGAGIRLWWLSATFALLAILLAVWWFFPTPGDGHAPAYRTVAVLPFTALSERETDR